MATFGRQTSLEIDSQEVVGLGLETSTELLTAIVAALEIGFQGSPSSLSRNASQFNTGVRDTLRVVCGAKGQRLLQRLKLARRSHSR